MIPRPGGDTSDTSDARSPAGEPDPLVPTLEWTLGEVRRRRVTVEVVDGKLRCRAPRGALDETLRRALKAWDVKVMERLAGGGEDLPRTSPLFPVPVAPGAGSCSSDPPAQAGAAPAPGSTLEELLAAPPGWGHRFVRFTRPPAGLVLVLERDLDPATLQEINPLDRPVLTVDELRALEGRADPGQLRALLEIKQAFPGSSLEAVDPIPLKDPRTDLEEDSHRWGAVLAEAGRHHRLLAALLFDLRCQGSRLRRLESGQLHMDVIPEAEADERQEIRQARLKPWTREIQDTFRSVQGME